MLNLENPKILPKELTITLVETQQLPDIGKVDSTEEMSCLKSTTYNGRRKICINFQADTDKVNIVVYRYRNNTCLKDTEMELNLTEYEKLLAQRLHLLSCIDIFLGGELYWLKKLFIIDSKSVASGRSPSCTPFPILLESKITF